jgi:hypothetical protein
MVPPAFAQTNEGKETKSAPSSNNANVSALVGVLETKGVITPAEASAIRSAAPEAEFRLLVETLGRKGVLN